MKFKNIITKSIILSLSLTLAMEPVSAFASSQLISAGAARKLDSQVRESVDTTAPAETEGGSLDVAGAGEASAKKRADAAATVASIMREPKQSQASEGDESVSENEIEEYELTEEEQATLLAHAQALAVVTGEAVDDGTIAGYTNLGIAKVDNWLNVRKEPSEDAEIIGKMPKNAGCEIVETKDEWAHIKSGRVDGWAAIEYMYIGEEAKAKAPECIRLMATVTTTTLYVRSEPTTESSIITMVPMEEELEVVEELDEWCKISIDDEEGYISKDYVNLAEKLERAVTIQELRSGQGVSDVRISMVSYAKQFLGNPYVWGGTSLTKGTDCSGFTMGIYRKFGVSLPRNSRSQATVGTKVSVSNLKPGDLVFYGKGSYINHVAMYIGGGQVIHASSKKTGIKISNVGYRTPITCRRILND